MYGDPTYRVCSGTLLSAEHQTKDSAHNHKLSLELHGLIHFPTNLLTFVLTLSFSHWRSLAVIWIDLRLRRRPASALLTQCLRSDFCSFLRSLYVYIMERTSTERLCKGTQDALPNCSLPMFIASHPHALLPQPPAWF